MYHPVLFQIGPVPIYTYGFCVAVGVLTAIFLMKKQAAREGLTLEETVDLVLWFTLTSFLGARIFYIAQHWDYFIMNPAEIVRIWEGGIVFYGGVFAGLFFLYAYSRAKKWPYTRVTDFIAPYIFLAHVFGRLGCFLNGCCYGKETGLPWAVHYPFLSDPVHPVQLYSAAWNLIAFGLLYKVHREKKFHGETSAAYFIAYGMGRFVIEFFRGDNPPFLLGLTIAQTISVGMLAIGILLYFICRRRA